MNRLGNRASGEVRDIIWIATADTLGLEVDYEFGPTLVQLLWEPSALSLGGVMRLLVWENMTLPNDAFGMSHARYLNNVKPYINNFIKKFPDEHE